MSRWRHLHFQQDRALELCVIRVEREAAKGTKRDPRVSGFVMLDELIPLPQIAAQYRRRFSQEHGYRFLKQHLLWTRVHPRDAQRDESKRAEKRYGGVLEVREVILCHTDGVFKRDCLT